MLQSLGLVLSVLGIIVSADGTETRPNEDFTNEDRIVEARPATRAVLIDGLLNEADWSTARAATSFRQYEPSEGDEPSQRTEVRVLYAEDAVYIGATLYDTQPNLIEATLGRRDESNRADWFFASIDSYLDLKTAYTFGVNAAGVQLDGIMTDDVDTSWDAIWQSSVRVTPNGWTAEMRIPLTMLRFSDGTSTWGINFTRTIPRTGEELEWAMVPRTVRRSGYVARYGRLHGLVDLAPRRNVQVLPYTVSRLDTDRSSSGTTASTGSELGVDMKVGLTSNITLDATFNPDFGQVDSDPAELNLTAFETFLRERRPFFVEGAQILDFSLNYDGSLLYSRRIGASDPIIGATKITGRTGEGWSFGVLGATTGADFSPDRYYSVTRVRREFGRYSYLGAIGTGFRRSIAGQTLASMTTGVDWDLRFDGNQYQVEGFATMAHRGGSFLDQNQTGHAASISLDRVRGTFTWSTSFRLFSPDYNPNDLGRLRRNDFMRASVSGRYQFNDGGAVGPFLRASVRGFAWKSWSYAERLDMGAGVNLSGDLLTRRFQRIGYRVEVENIGTTYDLLESRGMGVWQAPLSYSGRFSFDSDSRRSWAIEPSISVGGEGDGGRSIRTGLELEWIAGSRLDLSADVGISRRDNQSSWVSNETFARSDGAWMIGAEDGSPEELSAAEFVSLNGPAAYDSALSPRDGTYYRSVFGRRDTRSADVSLRSNVTFSPNLSLQLYGQLFAARGQYDEFSLLESDGTTAAFDEYPKAHDFSLSSFQTNVVLRWEYRPGSTLFVVWSQSRSDRFVADPLDPFAPSPFGVSSVDQLTDTFGLFPKNSFLIKLNYVFLP